MAAFTRRPQSNKFPTKCKFKVGVQSIFKKIDVYILSLGY